MTRAQRPAPSGYGAGRLCSYYNHGKVTAMPTPREAQRAARDAAKAKRLRDFFSHIKRTYGLTEDDYRALYRAQGGKCYVCRRAAGKSRMLGVDHNHDTGEVRGLVCTGSLNANTCNRLIAIYSRDALLRAAAMLSDPPPARAVLAAVAAGGAIPSVVGNAEFTIDEVRRDG